MKQHFYGLFLALAIISFSCRALSPLSISPTSQMENADPTPVEKFNITAAPTIDWLLFLGPENVPMDIVADINGNNYVLLRERTNSNNADYNYRMLSLVKISSTGNKEWQISVAESYTGALASLAIDSAGFVYVAGASGKEWGEPINRFVASGELENDFFVAKIDNAGQIVWNTFLGNSGATNIAADTDGNLYLVTYDAFNTAKKSDYTFVKLDNQGNIVTTNKISGLTSSYPYLLTVATNGNVYVSGDYRASIDANPDCFLSKLSSDGVLLWNTFIGGQGQEGIAGTQATAHVDQSGNVYFIGISDSSWGEPLTPYDGGYVMEDPAYEWQNGQENFIAKIDDQGNLVWHTFLNKSVSIYTSLLDKDGNLIFVGYSNSTWGNPLNQPNLVNGNDDGFIAFMDTNTGSTEWTAFIGGDGHDFIHELVIGNAHQFYVIGGTDKTFGNPINDGGEDGIMNYFIASLFWQ